MHTHPARARRAQGMTEYILLVGLVAMLLVMAVSLFGGAVEGAYDEGTRGVARAAGNPIPPRLPPKTPGNPYEWNHAAGRWYDPGSSAFVSFDDVAPYEADPRRYLR